ncbi:hypothetical protein [Methylomicrobium album]|uniref:hypothetical protein n=1 Tax=Methylomicrobium album TaxID=39775 RepID=UPI001BC89A1F|nr:hypothetical protein [Methylomicrobium album]
MLSRKRPTPYELTEVEAADTPEARTATRTWDSPVGRATALSLPDAHVAIMLRNIARA